MFKTDKESLEKLSFEFDVADMARFRKLLDIIQGNDLSSLPRKEILRLSSGLEQIGRLKLEGKIYAFHIFDNYAFTQSQNSAEGVELYLRQGDLLKDFLAPGSGDYVSQVDVAIERLRKAKIKVIYTGPIPYKGKFLGLSQDSEDPDGPIIRKKLEYSQIDEFGDEGISVVSLDC